MTNSVNPVAFKSASAFRKQESEERRNRREIWNRDRLYQSVDITQGMRVNITPVRFPDPMERTLCFARRLAEICAQRDEDQGSEQE